MDRHIQEHFPHLFSRDRREVRVDQIVRIREDWDPQFGGMWMLVKEIDTDFLTGMVVIEGEDPRLVRVPRLGVESAMRALGTDASKWV